MELISLSVYLGFYENIYDSTKTYNESDFVELLFMNKLSKVNINDSSELPLSVLFKMYNEIDFNKKRNISNYIKITKCLNKLNGDQIKYNIYIDNCGQFRRIIIVTSNKPICVMNMYF